MRVIADKVEIDDKKTKDFFSRRGVKYNEKNPYSLTMYQDNHPELVRERNKYEVQILKPLLQLDSHSRVLDFAAGGSAASLLCTRFFHTDFICRLFFTEG